MTSIIVIMGLSGAGKDYAADYMARRLSGVNVVKFSRPFKAFLESSYNLPYGWLDKADNKSKPAPPGGTWADLMVRWWKLSPELDPQLWLRQTKKQVHALLDLEAPYIVFNDVRNQLEVEFIAELAQQHFLHVLHISGAGTALPSDAGLLNYRVQLTKLALSTFVVENNFTSDFPAELDFWLEHRGWAK